MMAAATFAGGGMLALSGAADAAVAAPAAHSASHSATKTYSYKVVNVKKGHYLAVRASANSHSRIIGYLKADTVTTGTGQSSHGYLKVKASNGKTGWAPQSDLKKVK
jgi:uncharacterized protein YgiM (DUF1202 family)